ncbi:MAG: HipA domain-containing protein [Rhodospirillaceae bacterium]|nr:HipA domain-containing protein [Rhodospirillaceae bacterium]
MTDKAKQTTVLSVRLHDRQIGTITRLSGDRQLFAFDESYIDDANRQTLSLSFKSASGGLVTSLRPYTLKLPQFFSNLLPEGHLREYLARQIGVKPEREFFLLAALGLDLPGAVTVVPLDGATVDDGEVAVKRADKKEDTQLRFSLAGVQLKFSAIAAARGGLTIPANGIGGAWIVKLPSMTFPAVSENEYAMLALARKLGIEVPQTRLVPVSEIQGLPEGVGQLQGSAFVVERFDRTSDGKRVHMEDFAQVFGLFPDEKYGKRNYSNIAAVLWAEIGEEAVNDFMRRLVFSIVIGNGDMHLKNWTLLYRDGVRPSLSPAYDFVSTVPYIPNDNLALKFGGDKNLRGISQATVRRFAEKAGLAVGPLWRTVDETIAATRENWRTLPEADLLPKNIRDAINAHIEGVNPSE